MTNVNGKKAIPAQKNLGIALANIDCSYKKKTIKT